MGVFTVIKQARLGLNLRTPWWLSNASIDLDFRNQRYYDSSLAVGSRPLAPLSSYLSCTRASTGYAKKADGSLASFANNTLRITDLGLLVEDVRTNSIFPSADFSGWNIVDSTITTNASTAPDGTLTANKLVGNATSNADHSVWWSASLSTGTYAFSIFVKAAGAGWAYFMAIDASNNRYSINVDLTTGAITSTSTDLSPSSPTASVEAYGNGWFRISIVMGGSTGSNSIQVGMSTSATPTWSGTGHNNAQSNGDGSSGIYIWGAQIEGGGFASSYIPTTSATVTRAFDAVPLSGAAATTLSLSAASCKVDVGQMLGPTQAILVTRSETGTQSWFRVDQPASFNGVDLWNNSADVKATFGNSALWPDTTVKRVAFAWDGTGRSVVANGGTVGTDAGAIGSNSTPELCTSQGSNNLVIFGYIQRFTLWNTRLADATLQAFTVP